MASTRLFIPAKHKLPEMGELSDITSQLARQYNLPETEPGTYQYPTFQLVCAPKREHRPESLTYSDKVCTITFQHIPEEGIRQVHYAVLTRHLDGQLNLLNASDTALGREIAKKLEEIRKQPIGSASQFVAFMGLYDFSGTRKLLEEHINT
jgi:hypothetical protein